jgi:hypothetical protein
MRVRHPLGLPAGSVRALLAIMVIGTIWILLLMPPSKMVTVPLYLYYLMFLILGCYFAGRGQSPKQTSEPPPLHLPRGTIRVLLVAGTLGVLGFAIYRNSAVLEMPLVDLRLPEKDQPTLLIPVIILGSYLLGIVTAAVANAVLKTELGLPGWYQDTLAWVSVIAVLALAGVVIYLLVINPSVDPTQRPHFPHWIEYSLSGIVAFYFGARS